MKTEVTRQELQEQVDAGTITIREWVSCRGRLMVNIVHRFIRKPQTWQVVEPNVGGES